MYQKLQTGRATAMTELLSDNEDTVNLNDVIISGTAFFGSGASQLVDSLNRNFRDFGVQPGDLVVNTSNPSQCSRIKSFNSSGGTLFTINNVNITSGQSYRILKQSSGAATLYVGTVGAGATLKVRTAGGDDVVLDNLVQGTTIPLQVVRVYNTGTTNVSNIVALF